MRLLIFLSGVLTVIVALIMLPSFTDTSQLPIPARSFLSQVVRSIDMNRSFSLCGEEVPISNPDVFQRLDRELIANAYQHGAMVLQLKRSGAYFPVFERILAEHGIPDDMKYLAVAESALAPTAVSTAKAKGLWQFMEGTAREYGLEVNAQVDERLHTEKSTRAACRMLRSLYNKFGSWSAAAASYNMGPAGLNRDQTAQRVSNYYDTHLNQETSRYVFRIIAIKDIMENPEAYGFFIESHEKYQPLEGRAVEVTNSIANLAEWAIQHGTNLRMLKFYNPWLVGESLTVRPGTSYEIILP